MQEAHDRDVDFNHAERHLLSFLMQIGSKKVDLHWHVGEACIPSVVLFLILADTLDDGYAAGYPVRCVAI